MDSILKPKGVTTTVTYGQFRSDVLIFLAVWPNSSALVYVEEMSDGIGATWHLDVPFL